MCEKGKPQTDEYSVDVVTTESALRELRQPWQMLAERAENPNIFASFEWASAWWEHFGHGTVVPGEKQLHIMVVRAGPDVVAIVPLMMRIASRGALKVRKLQFLDGGLADYNELLIGEASPDVLRLVLTQLRDTRSAWDLIELWNIREAPNTRALIADGFEHSGLCYRLYNDERCPYLPIHCDWNGLVKRFSYSSRRTFRNQEYRLQRMGVTRRIVEDPLAARVLERIMRLQAQNGRERLLLRFGEWFRSLACELAPTGQLFVALLERGDELIAYQIGFRCGKKLWDYTKGFNPRYAGWSPGTMLVPIVMDYGFRNGYEEYDFLRGEEAYKYRFANEYHQNVRLIAWSQGSRSQLMASMYRVRASVRLTMEWVYNMHASARSGGASSGQRNRSLGRSPHE